MRTEKLRRHDRTQLPKAVRLSWEDRIGRLLEVRGKGIDRSPGGPRVEVSEPVPVGTFVHVQAGQHERVGSGYVRHCVRKGVRHVVGAEFTQAVHWKDDPGPIPTDAR